MNDLINIFIVIASLCVFGISIPAPNFNGLAKAFIKVDHAVIIFNYIITHVYYAALEFVLASFQKVFLLSFNLEISLFYMCIKEYVRQKAKKSRQKWQWEHELERDRSLC